MNKQIEICCGSYYDALQSYKCGDIFHTAFDCARNPYEAIEALIEIGIDDILTSVLKVKEWDVRELIAHFQKKYGDKIEILAGSGINDTNVVNLIKETGIYKVCSFCKDWLNNLTTSTSNVTYGYANAPNANNYEVVSSINVSNLVRSIINER